MKMMSYEDICKEIFDENNKDIYYVVVMTNQHCEKCHELISYMDELVEQKTIPSHLGELKFVRFETDNFLLMGPTIFPAVAAYKRGERCWEGHGLPPNNDMEPIRFSIEEWMKNYK